jgi:hypothetical protein
METTNDSIWRFAKVLSSNDLGLTGSHQAGVLLPRRSPIHKFLPQLDESTPNPSSNLELWSPQRELSVLTRYVYYNSKPLGTGTRNEYRLTRLTSFFRQLNPRPGSCLVFLFKGAPLGGQALELGSNQPEFPQVLIELRDIAEPSDDQWTIEEIPFDKEL